MPLAEECFLHTVFLFETIFDIGKQMPSWDGEIHPGVTKKLQLVQGSFRFPLPDALSAL